LVGGLIMAHGDDGGLRLPPAVAPVQVVVLVVRAEGGAAEAATGIAADLRRSGLRVQLDDRVATSFGRRAVEWELKGVPVRVEVGPRDVAAGTATLVRRDTGAKQPVRLEGAAAAAAAALGQVHATLLREATELRQARTVEVGTVDEALKAAQEGFARLPWSAVGTGGEARLATGGASVRCLQSEDGSLALDPDAPDVVAYVARAY
jgi:prolyl-tRNA synthetase